MHIGIEADLHILLGYCYACMYDFSTNYILVYKGLKKMYVNSPSFHVLLTNEANLNYVV